MEINIGENLKRLRKAKCITQENLAQFLGVSFQAISKWERNEGYPDIVLLPRIANFFDVTLDELVGMEQIKSEQKIEKLKETLKENKSYGRIQENINLLREAIKSHPNNYELLAALVHNLGFVNSDTEEQIKTNIEEGILLGERIIEFCSDPMIVQEVKHDLCYMYLKIGEKDKGLRLANTFPSMWTSKEFMGFEFLEDDQQIEALQKTVLSLVGALDLHIRDLVAYSKVTIEEKILMLNKRVQLIELMYEEGDYYWEHTGLSETCSDIAKLAVENNQLDLAMAYLEKAVHHAVEDTKLEQSRAIKKQQSVLFNQLTYRYDECSRNFEYTWCHFLKESLESNKKFDKLREMEQFKKFIKILDEQD